MPLPVHRSPALNQWQSPAKQRLQVLQRQALALQVLQRQALALQALRLRVLPLLPRSLIAFFAKYHPLFSVAHTHKNGCMWFPFEVPPVRDTAREGRRLLAWLGQRDTEGVAELRDLVGDSHPVVEIPLMPDEPTDLEALTELGELFEQRLQEAIAGREL